MISTCSNCRPSNHFSPPCLVISTISPLVYWLLYLDIVQCRAEGRFQRFRGKCPKIWRKNFRILDVNWTSWVYESKKGVKRDESDPVGHQERLFGTKGEVKQRRYLTRDHGHILSHAPNLQGWKNTLPQKTLTLSSPLHQYLSVLFNIVLFCVLLVPNGEFERSPARRHCRMSTLTFSNMVQISQLLAYYLNYPMYSTALLLAVALTASAGPNRGLNGFFLATVFSVSFSCRETSL